jgi:hypothetical protein
MVSEIEAAFPRLRPGNYRITSSSGDSYNCIAWAAGSSTAWWWPDEHRAYWPEGVPNEETVPAFQHAFASLGYLSCEGKEVEPGFEKIALFADETGAPTHAARQLSTGRWTSKLGLLEDIEHELHDLEGAAYGSVVSIMRRAVRIPERS